MAFKKTGMGSVQVTPVGMPDLSGYKNFAKALESTAQSVGSIGTSMRKREFTEALLQAEIDGKTAGVTYDKDGNLTPLINLDYGVASNYFGSNDARNLQLAFEKNAIASYALAIGNDSNSAANNALSLNPNNPNAIRASFDGYLKGLEDMPDKVRNAVMPNIVSNFMEAENRAKAAQIQQVRADQEASATEAINIASTKMARLMASPRGPLYENRKMVEDLQNDIISAQEVLVNLGYTDSQIQEQNRKIQTNIAIAANELVVDNLMADGKYLDAYYQIQDIIREYEEDPNIDSTAVTTAMNQVWAYRTKQKQLVDDQNRTVSTNIYNQLLMDIVDPEKQNPNVRGILDTAGLNEGHKLALINTLSNAEANRQSAIDAAKKAEQEIYDNQYDTYMIAIDNPNEEEMEDYFDSANAITQMYLFDQIDPKKYNDFVQKFSKHNKEIFDDARKENAAQLKAKLSLQMGEVGGYTIPPQEFDDILGDLESKGVITVDGPFTFNDASSMLNSYTKNYNTANSKRHDLALAVKKAKNNLTLTSSEIDLIDENLAPKSVSVDGNIVSLDVTSDDPIVREESLAAAVSYSVQYPNIMHPQVRQVIKDLPFIVDENSFDASKQFLGTLSSAMRSQGQYGKFIQNLSRNGLDQSVLWNAENYSFNDFKRIYENQGENAQRKISALLPSDASKDDYFLRQFKDLRGTSEGKQVYSIFYSTAMLGTKTTDDLSDNERAIIRNFEDKYGVAIEDAILEDPRIISLIQENSFSYVASGRYDATDKGFRGAIIKSLSDLIGVVGIEEVGDEYVFTLKPILHEANKTTPEAITVTKDDIIDDVIYRINEVPSLSTSEWTDAISSRENFFFELNDQTFDHPSYDVYVKVGRENLLVFPGYRYNFNHSYANDNYMKAMDSFQNDTTKKLWRMVPFVDSALLSQTFKKYQSTDRRTYSNKNLVEDMITFYNNTISYNLGGLDPIDPDSIGDRDIDAFVQSWMTLGFR